MSYRDLETFRPVAELQNRSGIESLSSHVNELQLALHDLLKTYKNTKGEAYRGRHTQVIADARTFRRERLRSWGQSPRGELIIEGERGANIQVTKSQQGELNIENTALIWEPNGLNEEQVRADTIQGGPVEAAHGAVREQYIVPLARIIRRHGTPEGEIAAYYDRQTHGQPQAVEYSYIDPLGKTKHECITAARNGMYIRRKRTEAGDSVVTENLGAQYDLSKEFDILESRVQESVHIRALGELAQKEYLLLTSNETRNGEYTDYVEDLIKKLNDHKNGVLERVGRLEAMIEHQTGSEAEKLRRELRGYVQTLATDIQNRINKVKERSSRVLSNFGEYKQRFAKETGDKSGVLVSKPVVELTRGQLVALKSYEKKVRTQHAKRGDAGILGVRNLLQGLQ